MSEATPAAQKSLREAEACLALWNKLREAGLADRRDALLRRGLADFPREVEVFERALTRLGEESETAEGLIEAWMLVAAAHPKREAAWMNLPPLLAKAGRFAECESALASASRALKPEVAARPFSSSARALLKAGEGARAEAILRKALEAQPGTLVLWQTLIAVLKAGADSQSYRAALREAVRLFPEEAVFKDRLATELRSDRAQAPEAIELLRALMASGGPTLELRLRLAEALALAGEREAAVEQLRAAIEMAPEDPRPVERLARMIQSEPGGQGQALALWSELTRRFPGEVRFWVRAVQSARALDDVQQSDRLSRDALLAIPDAPEVLRTRMQVLRWLEDHTVDLMAKRGFGEERNALAERALKLHPDEPILAPEFVSLFEAHDREGMAYRLLLRNLRRNPQHLPTLHHLSRFTFAAARHEAALGYCRRALEISPKAQQPRLMLAHFLTLMGRVDEAIAALSAAPEPLDAEIEQALGRARAEQVAMLEAASRWERACEAAAPSEALVLELVAAGDVGAAVAGLQALGERGRQLIVREMAAFYGHSHRRLHVLREHAILAEARKADGAAGRLRRLRWSSPPRPGATTLGCVARLRAAWPADPEVIHAADAVASALLPLDAPPSAVLPPPAGLAPDAAALLEFRNAARETMLGKPRLPPTKVLAQVPALRPAYAVLSQLQAPARRAPRQRVAVCVSGELRELDTTWPSIRERLIEPLKADVFLHSWKLPGGVMTGRMIHDEGPIRQLLRRLPPDLILPRVFAERFPTVAAAFAPGGAVDAAALTKRLGLTGCVIESFASVAPFLRARPGMMGFAAMTYGISMAHKMMLDHAKEHWRDYDVVIRIRPDLLIDSLDVQELLAVAALPGVIGVLPFEPTRGIHDQFAVGSGAAMRLYATAWACLEAADQVPYLPGQNADTPEGLLAGHVFACGIEARTLRNPGMRLLRPGWRHGPLLAGLARDLPALEPEFREAVLAGLQDFAHALLHEALLQGLAPAAGLLQELRSGFAALPGTPAPWLAERAFAQHGESALAE